jgi:hypothetical protein
MSDNPEKTKGEGSIAHIMDHLTIYLETKGINDKCVSHSKNLQLHYHLSYADVLPLKFHHNLTLQLYYM